MPQKFGYTTGGDDADKLPDYYRILHVHPADPIEVWAEAYKKQLLIYHPDRNRTRHNIHLPCFNLVSDLTLNSPLVIDWLTVTPLGPRGLGDPHRPQEASRVRQSPAQGAQS